MAPPIQVVRLVNSHGEPRRRKTAGFNEYIPSTSAPNVHERVKFTSEPQGMSATLRNIVRPQRLEQMTVSSESLSGGIGSSSIQQDNYHMAMEEDTFTDEELGPQNKRRRAAGDNPLLSWIDHRDMFLHEMLRHAGRGDNITSYVCCACSTGQAIFRCKDCFGSTIYCQGCIVSAHSRSPIHRVEKWSGSFFQTVTLKDLGLRVQLGHKIGQSCILPSKAFNDDFVLIDTHGIHPIGIDFCGCEMAQSHATQLLRAGWFPATTSDPRTAATFRVLRQYHILSFESKVSAYEFYHSLVRLTDNTGLLKRKDRYEAFMRMIREWRNLQMLKRAGRGHDPCGLNATQQGQCAVLCPACPQPGKNVPDGWHDVPIAKRWLYGQFIAIDANFRLKRRLVSKDAVDPSLSPGWAYFVDNTTYQSHLINHGKDIQEKSTCASHNAVNMAETKASHGLAATGLGTVDCAHHNMKLPNGVGDLQKGERYINMDFLFFLAMRHRSVGVLNISYDIACQWSKNLWTRMASFPDEYQLDHISNNIRFFVPKFHLPAHIAKCQTMFSFNWSRWVGRTDGEAPERGWSNINPVASSTKEMGPGSRQDTLDDHFGDWNWKKVVNLGASLLRKMNEATQEKLAFEAAFEELDNAITSEHRTGWQEEVNKWECNPNDTSVPNPFEAKTIPITQANARLKLAQLEARDLEKGVDVSLHPDISPGILIASGMDLEEEQRRVMRFVKGMGNHVTDTQKSNLQRQRNTLQRKIEAWRKTQALYMPVVPGMLSTVTSSSPSVLENPEGTKLWLPSAIGDRPCHDRLRVNEWELCLAQAHDALEELRQCLRIRSSLLTYKKEWVRGQGANTRAQNTLERIMARQAACTGRYHAAWDALDALAQRVGKIGWQQTLRQLEDDDIRPLVDPYVLPGQGRRKLTWIWTMSGVDTDGDGTDEDGVRVEWCKARARAMRWSEEVELLHEEMSRVIQFFQWQVDWWEEQRYLRSDQVPEVLEGLAAYAAKQASIRRAFEVHFRKLWAPYLSTDIVPLIAASSSLPFPDEVTDLPDLSAPLSPNI
ncbi:hypothetical protein M405DRAFT_851366 [Rhizopogon salebrosus TDB-379]|nr:hypothetical protein M405DRAFT_851366 [Rhizopogon salebrosus TDB-379]